MYSLRGYQGDAVREGLDFLLTPQRDVAGLIVAPTGSGKSLVIANIVKHLSGGCIVFQPSKEILEQNAAKLTDYGFPPAIYSASAGRKEVGQITLATIGSVASRPDLFSHVRYVIFDEAHLVNPKGGQLKTFTQMLGSGVRMLGLTATPFRLYTNSFGSMLRFLTRTRPNVFSKLVHATQIPDLVRHGYIAKPVYQRVTGFDVNAVEGNKSGSDYAEASLKRYYKRVGFDDRVVRTVRRAREVGRKRMLIFTSFVENAQNLADAVRGVEVLTGETPKAKREAILDGLRRGDVDAVANVGVAGTGLDIPQLDTVVLARPTRSLALYMQQLGRVVRPFPGLDKWVIDMVDSLGMFGPMEQLRLVSGGKKGTNYEFIGASGKPLTNVSFGFPSRGR